MERTSPSLSVVHALAPARFGGLETVILTLCRAQRDHGDAVCVAPVLKPHESDGHPVVEALREQGLDVQPIVVAGRDYRGERAAIRSLLRSRSADVLHTHGYRPDVIDAPVARRLGIGTVSTVHGFTRGDFNRHHWRGRLYEWLQIRSFRRFEAVVVVSNRLRGEMEQEGVRPERLHVLRNAWEPTGSVPTRAEARAALGIDGDEPTVAWVGRLSIEKAPDLFVRAAGMVADPSVRVSVVGAGSMTEECGALADSLGIRDRIRWHGAVPEAGKYLSAFDALVISSWTEGTPMVLLEAMAAGVPVVTTAVGGIPDVVSPEEAILCEAGDVGALAAGIDSVLADPGAARTRADAAARRLRTDFAVEPWARRYRDIYLSILGDR